MSMAARAHLLKHQKSPLRTTGHVEAELPGGRCNYTVLNVGGGRCGCQRYWDKRQQLQEDTSQPGWCMCGHHACYHESNASIQRTQRTSTQSSAYVPSISSTVRNSIYHAMEWNQRNGRTGADSDRAIPQNPPTRDSHLLDTEGHSQSPSGMPRLPQECLLPPDISSGGFKGDSQAFLTYLAEGSDVRGFQEMSQQRLEAAQALQRLQTDLPIEDENNTISTHVNTPVDDKPPVELVDGLGNHVALLQMQVARMTKGASDPDPSLQNLHETCSSQPADLEETIGQRSDVNAAIVPLRQVMSHLSNLLKHVPAFPNLDTTMANHSRRIDLLENASYSNLAVDELRGQTESLEELVRDIEIKVDDLTKTLALLNDSSANPTRDVVVARSPELETHSELHLADITDRLEALENQLAGYQASAMPSYSNSWELEVIYLPYGLKGVWYTAHDFPSQRSRTNSTVDWSQAQPRQPSRQPSHSSVSRHVRSSSIAVPHTPAETTHWQDLAEEEDEGLEWLLPRAFSPGTKIEERLRSRGLIKTITIRGPDARDVHAAVMSSFTEVLEFMSTYDEFQDHSYLGLRAPWIPLRKEHKNSMLRLLDPSEMVTPALWTVPFLSSGVVMRATGLRRLFVTHRDAYLQSDSCCNEWTWQRLQELPRVSVPDSEDAFEHSDLEQCWEYDSRLDFVSGNPILNVESSFDSNVSALSMRFVTRRKKRGDSSSSSVTDLVADASSYSAAATTTNPKVRPTSTFMDRRQHLKLQRTQSLPSVPVSSAPPVKRPLYSYNHTEASSYPTYESKLPPSSPPRSVPAPIQAYTKRRRISNSPQPRQRRSPPYQRNTPHWSVGPPSPYISEDVARGTTPFAYATPHSNSRNSGEWFYEDLDAEGSVSDGDSLIDGEVGGFLEGLEGFLLGDSDEEDDDSDDDEYRGVDEIDYDEDDVQYEHRYGMGQQGEDEVWEGVEEDNDNVKIGRERSSAVDMHDTGPEKHALSDDEAGGDSDSVDSPPSEYTSTQRVSKGRFDLV